MNLAGKTIILGICGGIAAYKSPYIVRFLKKMGADVHVVMTSSAQSFIGKLTLEAISENPVHTDLFADSKNPISHISLATHADAIVIAPATANTIAKITHGIADNLLTSTILAATCPIFIAPAMNSNMYNNIATQNNIKILKERNFQFIGPIKGLLACGINDIGKMSEPDEIANFINQYFSKPQDLSLKGKNIVITAGPTIEPIDPVRYISNKSSGKMGYALATQAQKLGANVTLISGPVTLEKPQNSTLINVKTADEMLQAVNDNLNNCDIFIACAAVADYRSKTVSSNKIKKENNEELTIKLVKNPDILKSVGFSEKRPPIVIGFAAETNNLEENALKKLQNKGADFIILNDVSQNNIGFNSDNNKVTIYNKKGGKIDLEISSKSLIAQQILEICAK